MEESGDRLDEIKSDDYLQQYAELAVYTLREFGTKFWEWCGHSKVRLQEFLSFKPPEELNENWVEVYPNMETSLTETPQQHLFEEMQSYGTAVTQDDDEAMIRILDEKAALTEKYNELSQKLASYERGSADYDDLMRKMADLAQDRDSLREEYNRRVDELLNEKATLQKLLDNERQEKEALLAAATADDDEKGNDEAEDDDMAELREQLLASREESSRLMALLNRYNNGVGLCSKFKTESEVQSLMLSIVPNEYTSAIELLESMYQMDPGEDRRPYDVCLKIFANVFRHTVYRQERFFEIIKDNSVWKIELFLAQKVFWGLIQDNFEMLGITPIDDVIEGILCSTAPERKWKHFVPIELDVIEEVLSHDIMREYMWKCAEISFFVLWSKCPRLKLCGWEERPDLDVVFDENIHDRIWGDKTKENAIEAVVFPGLYRVEEGDDGDEKLVLLTKRQVFCTGFV